VGLAGNEGNVDVARDRSLAELGLEDTLDRQKEREAAGEDITMGEEEEEVEDPVPELTRAHFEESRDRHRRSRGSCWQ
jgi:hypothetical protein